MKPNVSAVQSASACKILASKADAVPHKITISAAAIAAIRNTRSLLGGLTLYWI